MSSVVNTNLFSINTQRHLAANQRDLATSIEKLSSGKHINSAKDDAAGLAVAEGITTQIRGLAVSRRNMTDGISIAQTAEGLIAEIGNKMQRIRELAVQSANEVMSDDDRAHLHKESESLTDEIDRVLHSAKYNGILLLDTPIGLTLNLEIQVGANEGETVTLGIPGLEGINAYGTLASSRGNIDLRTAAEASHAISKLDSDLQVMIAGRATLGATINRFESVMYNIDNYSENLQAARSRILDTDFAVETAQLTRSQILSQAATSMLSQANQVPQGILSLLA